MINKGENGRFKPKIKNLSRLEVGVCGGKKDNHLYFNELCIFFEKKLIF
jgi:hypothetical protein